MCKFVVGVEPPGMLEVPKIRGPRVAIYIQNTTKIKKKIHYCKPLSVKPPTTTDLVPQFTT